MKSFKKLHGYLDNHEKNYECKGHISARPKNKTATTTLRIGPGGSPFSLELF